VAFPEQKFGEQFMRGIIMFFSCNQRKISQTVLFCVFLTVSITAFAGPRADKKARPDSGEKVIVASTSWVAAIAEAAGAKNVRILAPVELKHPPEYELRPSDLMLVSGADYVLYAGWERFAEKLTETAGVGATIVRIRTDNDPAVLQEEAEKLAAMFGTEESFRSWRSEFDRLTEDIQLKIHQAYPDRRAVVQRMQLPFIRWLGFEIIGEYGPAEPSPALIVELARLGPVLVIDNYHGPSGTPIAEAAGVPYAELINFPGKDGTKTLADVFQYNLDILIKASGR
jgi:hypothetical protein